jgi:hypothetical protein
MKHYIMSVDVIVMDDAVSLDEEEMMKAFFKVASSFKLENGEPACCGISQPTVIPRPVIPENDPVVVPFVRKTV